MFVPANSRRGREGALMDTSSASSCGDDCLEEERETGEAAAAAHFPSLFSAATNSLQVMNEQKRRSFCLTVAACGEGGGRRTGNVLQLNLPFRRHRSISPFPVSCFGGQRRRHRRKRKEKGKSSDRDQFPHASRANGTHTRARRRKRRN